MIGTWLSARGVLNSAAGKKAYPLLGLFDEMNVVSMMMMITLAAYNGTKRSDFLYDI